MASSSLFAVNSELIFVGAIVDIVGGGVVGYGMATAPEAVGVEVVGEGVGELGVAFIVPGVFATHVVAIAEGTAIFGVINKVAPGCNFRSSIIKRVRAKLGIGILKGQYAQFVGGFLDKVFFGNFC